MDRRTFLGAAAMAALIISPVTPLSAYAASKEIAYIAPSLSVSFWRYVAAGIEAAVKPDGYSVKTFDSNNDAATQLKNAQDAIARGVAGIVISPTDSSTAPVVLKLAAQANIPVVIADIGTTSGDYVSFVSSDNHGGAHGIGDALAAKLKEKGWQGGSFAIIGIPQARLNGQLRTAGFREAMAAAGFTKEAPMQEMKTFTADESFRFAQDMLVANPDLRAIFVQSDEQTIGVVKAVQAARKSDSVLVAGFDGTPALLKLIEDGKVVGSGMQQPYLMGHKAGEALEAKLGGGTPDKSIVVPVLAVTTANAAGLRNEIKANVFAGDLH